jgi:pimeloyl-ACP methyl ester carboxylesterase
VYWALSGGGYYADVWRHPSAGRGYLDVLPEAPPLPWPWLSAADFAVYAETFARTGFTGGLNLAGVHLIPGAGHFVQMGAAGDVNRLVLDFLRQLPGGPRG